MPRSTRRTIHLPIALIALAMLSSGCRLGELFNGKSVATVEVFATHAGTPDGDKQFPDYGEGGTTRVFVNDMGWEVALGEIYVTQAKVEVVPCGAPKGTPIEMFWGPCPEDFVIEDDRITVPLGAVTVDDGEYCSLRLTVAPYIVDPGTERHIIPENPAAMGTSVYIVGVARQGEGNDMVEIPFEVITDEPLTVDLDISKLENNRPVKLEDENYPRPLTILKTYDTFFEGIDFATAGPADLKAAVFSAIELDTIVYNGSSV